MRHCLDSASHRPPPTKGSAKLGRKRLASDLNDGSEQPDEQNAKAAKDGVDGAYHFMTYPNGAIGVKNKSTNKQAFQAPPFE